MTANQCATWDFTYPAVDEELAGFKAKIKQLFKKWTFQLEKGDSGYLHYQGRGSLYKKRRFNELKPLLEELELDQIHLSPTVTGNLGDTFYMIKADTRVEGPWTDRDVELYIPRQYRNITPYPWQQSVIDSCSRFDPRAVNMIYDPSGAKGKSTIAAICCLMHNGIRIPAVNDHEKLLSSVCDILTAKKERTPGPIFIDLPRFMDKRKLHGIFSAIEEIKNGHVYDMRYRYEEWWFDSPPVWVFSNIMPDISALSLDRWHLYEIHSDELVEVYL